MAYIPGIGNVISGVGVPRPTAEQWRDNPLYAFEGIPNPEINISEDYPELFKNDEPVTTIDTILDPVGSATKVTESNNQAGLNAATSANDINAETMEKAWQYYLESIEFLANQNIISAEKIMQMNENAQINAYNRNLSYLDEYYPRIVRSLAKAGINPILMASRGFGSPGNVSSAASIGAPYITSPSNVSGFAANVARLDFDTMRDAMVTVLKNNTSLQEAEINKSATVLAAIIRAIGTLGGSFLGSF